MSRWDPFGEALTLRDAMNRLFEQAVLQPSTEGGAGQRGQGGSFAPPLDVSETQDEYLVKASLPGVKPEDVNIQLHQGILTISGETREEQEREQGTYHIRERRQGRFSRSVSLPSPVDANRVEAGFNHGVLEVVIPKAEETKPRRIQVRAGAGAGATPIEASASQPASASGGTAGSAPGSTSTGTQRSDGGSQTQERGKKS